MDINRLLSLLELKGHYDRMGLRDPADYEAAGFTPEELAASGLFEAPVPNPVGDGETAVSAYEPQGREAAAYYMTDLLERKFGVDHQTGYRAMRDIFGSSDPSQPSHNRLGLVDLSPLGAYYDSNLGLDTIGRGIATGDLGTVGEGTLQTALGIAGLIPAVKGASKVVDTALDPLYLKQLETFNARNTPAFPVDTVAGYRTYIPSIDELNVINQKLRTDPNSLTPVEQDYVRRRADADYLRGAGVSDAEIAQQTSILNMPVVDAGGTKIGTRPYALLRDDEFAAVRPDAHTGWSTVYEDMEPSIYGEMRPGTKTVAINKISPEKTHEQTRRHEFTHVDLEESNINPAEVGSNTEQFDSVWPQGLTRYEMYARNPGEMLARLSSDDATMPVRLSAMETLNPYLNRNPNVFSRAADAAATSMFSDLYKYETPISLRWPRTAKDPSTNKRSWQWPVSTQPYRLPGYDLHVLAPMDMTKARMYDWELQHGVPWSTQLGGIKQLADYLDMGRTLYKP